MDDVSHELRTPATNISLYLDLLAQSQPDKWESYLAILNVNSRRLNDLIESILQFSDLSEAAVMVEPAAVQLNDLASEVVDLYRAKARLAGLELIFSPNFDLPTIFGSVDFLNRAIAYLLDNAIKYTPVGSINVNLLMDKANNMVCLQIVDTGVGIEREEVKQIFDPFYRGQQISQLSMPGAGLGLTLAKQIIIRHGGQIDIKSEPGIGTTVWLWLPVRKG